MILRIIDADEIDDSVFEVEGVKKFNSGSQANPTPSASGTSEEKDVSFRRPLSESRRRSKTE
jgi:hypothetical protein